MEKLYAVSGTFERAKESFEKYYADVMIHDDIAIGWWPSSQKI